MSKNIYIFITTDISDGSSENIFCESNNISCQVKDGSNPFENCFYELDNEDQEALLDYLEVDNETITDSAYSNPNFGKGIDANIIRILSDCYYMQQNMEVDTNISDDEKKSNCDKFKSLFYGKTYQIYQAVVDGVINDSYWALRDKDIENKKVESVLNAIVPTILQSLDNPVDSSVYIFLHASTKSDFLETNGNGIKIGCKPAIIKGFSHNNIDKEHQVICKKITTDTFDKFINVQFALKNILDRIEAEEDLSITDVDILKEKIPSILKGNQAIDDSKLSWKLLIDKLVDFRDLKISEYKKVAQIIYELRRLQ